MKDLLVIYDDQIKDKGKDSYLKAIKKEIPSAKIINIGSEKINLPFDIDKILVLKPINHKGLVSELWLDNPDRDIEGIYTNQLTITADAILWTLWSEQGNDLTGKTVLIINQSDVLGKPLAKELINRGANVISLNSSFDNYEIIEKIDPDILISASGNDDFKLKGGYLKDIKTIIDLSDDVDTENKITSIPTIEVLKDRLR